MSPSSSNPLTLDPAIVAPAFASDGSPSTGQVPSLTSTNNFINFCRTYPRLPNTNGSEIPTGSCNSAPMGHIPSIQNLPSVKIISPKHGDTIPVNGELRISVVLRNMEVVLPTSSRVEFLSAPQQLDYLGVITGNSWITVDEVSNLTDTRPTDPQSYIASTELDNPIVNGVSEARIVGMPSGVFRIAAQLRSSNSQPILVPIPEHGSLSDIIYITIGDGKGTGSGAKPGIVGNSTVSAAVNTQDRPQSAMMLDPKVVSGPVIKQNDVYESSLSSDNFIHDCQPTSLTNGGTVLGGSCNPVPMGVLPAKTLIPSSKFTNPKNGDNIPADEAFDISLAIRNFQTGSLANPQKSYLGAPQQVNAQGLIIGHAKVVIEALTGFNQTAPTDPTKFVFFEHIGSLAKGGILTASVSDGLPDGYYRLSSMLCATNSQPVLVPLSEVGMSDDAVYFTVGNPTQPTTTGVDDNDGKGSNDSDNPSTSSVPFPSPISSPPSRSTDKAAIIGGALGSVLGVIAICVLVYTITRCRRRKRRLQSVDFDAEVAQVAVTPFDQPAPYLTTREKPLPSGPSLTTSPDQEFHMAGRSNATSGIRHDVISESLRSDTETNPPPYQP